MELKYRNECISKIEYIKTYFLSAMLQNCSDATVELLGVAGPDEGS